jgi:hypothetical protein
MQIEDTAALKPVSSIAVNTQYGEPEFYSLLKLLCSSSYSTFFL